MATHKYTLGDSAHPVYFIFCHSAVKSNQAVSRTSISSDGTGRRMRRGGRRDGEVGGTRMELGVGVKVGGVWKYSGERAQSS